MVSGPSGSMSQPGIFSSIGMDGRHDLGKGDAAGIAEGAALAGRHAGR